MDGLVEVIEVGRVTGVGLSSMRRSKDGLSVGLDRKACW